MDSPAWRDKGPPCFWPARNNSFASSFGTWEYDSFHLVQQVFEPFLTGQGIKTDAPAEQKASPRKPSRILFTRMPGLVMTTSSFLLRLLVRQEGNLGAQRPPQYLHWAYHPSSVADGVLSRELAFGLLFSFHKRMRRRVRNSQSWNHAASP